MTLRTRIDDTLASGSLAWMRLHFTNHALDAGFDIRIRRSGGCSPQRSWSDAVRKRIFLRSSVDLNSARGVALLAHEVTHARQQSGSLLYRVAWGLRYLLDPWFRQAAEIEAKAWGVATIIRARYGPRVWMPSVEAWAKVSHSLGGWRRPHLTPGDPEQMTERIRDRALEILVDAE